MYGRSPETVTIAEFVVCAVIFCIFIALIPTIRRNSEEYGKRFLGKGIDDATREAVEKELEMLNQESNFIYRSTMAGIKVFKGITLVVLYGEISAQVGLKISTKFTFYVISSDASLDFSKQYRGVFYLLERTSNYVVYSISPGAFNKHAYRE